MTAENISIFLAGIATLAIFSFIIKENKLYRFFEHIFIGIASAWGIVLTFKNFLYPIILSPLLGLDRIPFPDGTYAEQYNNYNLLFLIPITFGLLYYTIYSARFAWLAQIAIGISLGAAGGLSFQGFFNQMLPQIESSMKPLVVFNSTGEFLLGSSLDNIIYVVTLLLVMTYFFFTFKKIGTNDSIQISARSMLMICFGAYFGSTVMARMALLVERIDFLLGDFASVLKNIIGGML